MQKTKNKTSAPEAGKIYIFTKSGNEVKAIEPTTPYLGQPMWTVERTSGQSAGKQMAVPASALLTPDEYKSLVEEG